MSGYMQIIICSNTFHESRNLTSVQKRHVTNMCVVFVIAGVHTLICSQYFGDSRNAR